MILDRIEASSKCDHEGVGGDAESGANRRARCFNIGSQSQIDSIDDDLDAGPRNPLVGGDGEADGFADRCEAIIGSEELRLNPRPFPIASVGEESSMFGEEDSRPVGKQPARQQRIEKRRRLMRVDEFDSFDIDEATNSSDACEVDRFRLS